MAPERNLLLGQRQLLALGYSQLPGDQILSGNGFGDRMLNLQSRIHLHEKELAARIQQKLDRTRSDITDCLGSLDCRCAHGPAQFDGQSWRWRFFHHFLMAPLDRAIAFMQIDAIPLLIAEHLNFHMPGLQ